MSQDENSYLQKYLKKLNPTIEIRDGPNFRRPRMARSIKSQSIDLGPKDDKPPSLIRVARVRSSTNKCRQELHVRPKTFDEPEQAPYLSAKPKLLDPLIPQQMSLLPSKHIPESLTNDRASTQWSLSSVSLAENDDVSDDELAVQRSLRNIRGSAKERRMTRNSQLSLFKAKTPQRDAKRRNSDPNTKESTDLSVLDILSEKRKQSREKMKVMIGGQYWLLKPLSNSSSATSTDTAISSKPSCTRNNTEIEQPEAEPPISKPKIKPRLRVRSQKTPPPPVPDETKQQNDVEIKNLYRFNPESNENPFGNSTTNQLTGNGSSTYPGFELIEKQKQPPTSKPIKLTGTSRNFAVQGVTTTIGQRQETQDSQVFDSLDVSIDLNETEQTETEQPNEAEKPKSRTMIRRPKSLPVHRTYTSFVSETPVPETNKPNTPQEKKKQSNVKAQLQEALDILPDSKTHWETTIEHLNNIRDITRDQTKAITPRAVEFTNLVIHHCNNIRSRISGAAIEVLSDVFDILGLNLVANIEPAIKALMTESGKENLFIREKCEKCFQTIVQVMCESNQVSAIQKLLSTLYSHSKSKNSTTRIITAQFIEQAVLHTKPDRCLSDTRDITDKLMNAMINAVNDSASDARYFGRRIVHHLADHDNFEKRCKQYLSNDDIKRINLIRNESKESLQSKSITKLKMTRSIYSNTSPKKSVSQRQATVPGLKEELNAAAKSTSLRDKVKSLDLMKQCIRERGTLGNELANGCDILCSMIKSAAVQNHRAAIDATNLFIPLIKDEKILVANLLKVLLDKINSSKVDVKPLLDQISAQCHPSILLPFYAQHINQSRLGRYDCCHYLLEAAEKLKDQKPSFVATYAKSAYRTIASDRSCVSPAAQLEDLLDNLSRESIKRGHNSSL